MLTTRIVCIVLLLIRVGWSQKPVISPGGVVNAASYAATSFTAPVLGAGVSGGSIASIFGFNLSASTESAWTVPLPTQLGGTSVMVDCTPAFLFYVSPRQINFQIPSRSGTCVSPSSKGLVVSTDAGSSAPYPLLLAGAEGLFSLDSSGCGRGGVLNVADDGTMSLNSPSNSAAPGQIVLVFGNGLGLLLDKVPDGALAPANPPARAGVSWGPWLDFTPAVMPQGSYWGGRAPGLVGVDQFNFKIPESVREGCAVPLQVSNDHGPSQPLTISIRKGGGPCVDPPQAGYGEILWEKIVTTSPAPTVGFTTETDSVTISLQTAPGKQGPVASYRDVNGGGSASQLYFGPACPIPGYHSLDAGTIAVRGPGLGPVSAPEIVPKEWQVSGLQVHRADLPMGTIQPGPFSVTAAGGSEVGPFQSSVSIGSEIHVTTVLAGRVLPINQAVTITWTGGDANSWVTLRFVSRNGDVEQSESTEPVRASEGRITMGTVFGFLPVPDHPDVILEVTPDPTLIQTFSAPGLSWGGRHLWKYTYRFEGILVQ